MKPKIKDTFTIALHTKDDWDQLHPEKHDWGWSLKTTKSKFDSIGQTITNIADLSYDELLNKVKEYDLELYNASSGRSRIFKYLGQDSKYKEDHWTTGSDGGWPRIELFIRHI